MEARTFGGRDELGGAGFDTDGVVAFEVGGYEIVSMNMFTDGDRLFSETYDLVEFADWLTRFDGVDGEFVSCGDVGDRREVKAGEVLVSRNGLEGDGDVV